MALPFFGIGMKTDLFQSCGHCWVFQIWWRIECRTLSASSFSIWNSSTGIPSPPLSFFIVMFPKAHLILHWGMSGPRWVITASWLTGTWRSFLSLTGTWRSFLYSSFVYFFHLFLISLLLLRDTTVHKFSLSGSLYKPVHTKGISLIKLGWQATPVLLPRKSHGWRSLVGCSPWGRYESDVTERHHFYFSLSHNGEDNGNPLQCSCLENPRDGRAWWAAVYGVAQSGTRLKWLSSSKSTN